MNALGSKDLDLNVFSSFCLSCYCCLQWPCLVAQQLQHDWAEMTLWKGDRGMVALHYCPHGFSKLYNVSHCSPRGSVNLVCTAIVPVKTESDTQTLLICDFFYLLNCLTFFVTYSHHCSYLRTGSYTACFSIPQLCLPGIKTFAQRQT